MMRWVVIVLAGLAGLVLLAAAIGWMLPKAHVASKTLRLSRPASEVWAAITDYPSMPQWRTTLARIERLPDLDGKPVWKETTKDGWELPLQDVAVEPPARLVRRIADPKLPFSGTWTYELRERDGGAVLTITEHGEVPNPLFRLMSRFHDPSLTIVEYQTALAARFGERAAIE